MSNMKRSKFTGTQIVNALIEFESGRKAEEVCQGVGISLSSVSSEGMTAGRNERQH